MKRREKTRLFPVSQRDLAAYLGISGTLLSMIETGRHGARNLSSRPLKKRAELLLAHHEAQKTTTSDTSSRKSQAGSASKFDQFVKVMSGDAAHAEAHVEILKVRLGKMALKEQEALHWMNTMELLLGRLPKNKESAKDRIWLEYQQTLALKKLQKNGWLAQAKLEIQIEMEKARVRIYRDVLKNLLKK